MFYNHNIWCSMKVKHFNSECEKIKVKKQTVKLNFCIKFEL